MSRHYYARKAYQIINRCNEIQFCKKKKKIKMFYFLKNFPLLILIITQYTSNKILFNFIDKIESKWQIVPCNCM